jgi:Alpha/beta hydrolase domain
VPLATYTGWSFRNKGIGGTEQFFPLIGSYVPFATTKTERERNGDPRPSIQERYQSRDQYLKLVGEATAPLVKAGYLLAADVPTVVKRASTHWDLLMQPTTTASSRAER